MVRPHDALPTDADTRQPRKRGWRAVVRKVVVCLALIAVAATFHYIIRTHYPENIDRSKWLAAYVILTLRNGFLGASIGVLANHAWMGICVGVFAPPIVIIAMYGVP